MRSFFGLNWEGCWLHEREAGRGNIGLKVNWKPNDRRFAKARPDALCVCDKCEIHVRVERDGQRVSLSQIESHDFAARSAGLGRCSVQLLGPVRLALCLLPRLN